MKSDILPIVSTVTVGALGTVNEDGSPWNTPIHLAVGEEVVVWLTSRHTQHGRNIERDDRVSIALWSDTEVEHVKGIYIQSRAEIVTGSREVAARQLYAERFGEIPEKFLAGDTYVAPLGELDDEKTRGGRLYFSAEN